MEKEIVYAFPHRDGQEVRFSVGPYQNRVYIDLRLYFKPSSGEDGELLPTKKGLTLPIEELAHVQAGLARIETYLSEHQDRLSSAARTVSNEPEITP